MTGEKILVKVDPDLEELIPGFLENRGLAWFVAAPYNATIRYCVDYTVIAAVDGPIPEVSVDVDWTEP